MGNALRVRRVAVVGTCEYARTDDTKADSGATLFSGRGHPQGRPLLENSVAPESALVSSVRAYSQVPKRNPLALPPTRPFLH